MLRGLEGRKPCFENFAVWEQFGSPDRWSFFIFFFPFFSPSASPVIERVSDVHVVGELLPQGRLQLALRLDGLQGLAQLTLGDLLQTDGLLQLAVEKLGVLLQAADLVLQTLKFHLREKGREKGLSCGRFKRPSGRETRRGTDSSIAAFPL